MGVVFADFPKEVEQNRRLNNPLGGMGMNGGIHDAINLTSRLVEVWHGAKAEAELERYDRQRRLVTLEYIEKHRSKTSATSSPTGPTLAAAWRRSRPTSPAPTSTCYGSP